MDWWSIIAKSVLNVTLSALSSSGLQSADLNPIQHLWDVVGQEICILDAQFCSNSVTLLCEFGPTALRNVSNKCWKYATKSHGSESERRLALLPVGVSYIRWLLSVQKCVCFQSSFKVIIIEHTFVLCSGHWNENQEGFWLRRCILGPFPMTPPHLDSLVMTRIKAPFSSFSLWFSIFRSSFA